MRWRDAAAIATGAALGLVAAVALGHVLALGPREPGLQPDAFDHGISNTCHHNRQTFVWADVSGHVHTDHFGHCLIQKNHS